ncbi:MAG: energy transducer TonB [Pseudomonadales bacterium]|nr:energy transducer TonB [Pseudomonadales bacterium]
MNMIKTTTRMVLAAAAFGLASSAHAVKIDNLQCSDNYEPVRQEAPVYPRRAQARGIQGHIVMGFTIHKDGTVGDIKVLDQDPENTFIRTATRAVESLQFPPCVVNGQSMEQSAVSIRYEFRLQ